MHVIMPVDYLEGLLIFFYQIKIELLYIYYLATLVTN